MVNALGLDAVSPQAPDRAQFVALTPIGRQALLAQMELVACEGGGAYVVAQPTILGLRVLLAPEGTGVVVVHVDWGATSARPRPWRDVLVGMNALRYAQAPGLHLAWRRRTSVADTLVAGTATDEWRAFVGPMMEAVLTDRAPVSLRAWLAWLLGIDEAHFDRSDYARLFSNLYFTEPLSEAHRSVVAFHATKGLHAAGFAAPPDDAGTRTWNIWAHRALAVASEGCAALTWGAHSEDADAQAEWRQWSDIWMEVYLLLLLHVLQERATLARLSASAATRVSAIAHASDAVADGRAKLADLELARRQLDALIKRIVLHDLTMAPYQASSTSGYASFHRALREQHGILPQRDNLRAQVRALQSIVDSAYLACQHLVSRGRKSTARATNGWPRHVNTSNGA